MSDDKYFEWLGQVDWDDLNNKHYDWQMANGGLVHFNTWTYWLWRGGNPDELDGIPELIQLENPPKQKGDSFEEMHAEIIRLAESGITKSVDIANEIGVASRTIGVWIKKGWLNGEKRPGDRGGAVWHVVV